MRTTRNMTALILTTVFTHAAFGAETTNRAPQMKDGKAELEKATSGWPERPRLGAAQMWSQYGTPDQMTSDKLIWKNKGPFKRITVTKKEDHHDFPLPHMDYMEHTVAFNVPDEKAGEISKFDGSATFDRTQGELSGRCDLEGHNILTLNLAHDIAMGKRDAQSARKEFGRIVTEDIQGKNPPYVTALQFQPVKAQVGFADEPVMPGSPKRPMANKKIKGGESAGGDGEALATLCAININEIVAAMTASKKQVRPEILQYAKMLHTEHGKNMTDTMKLAEKINIDPLETEAVGMMKAKAAGELAQIVPLQGEEFGAAYIDAMVKGHTEALDVIDNQMSKARNSDLKAHLSMTKQHVENHLQMAKTLQGSKAVGVPASSQQSQQNELNQRVKP